MAQKNNALQFSLEAQSPYFSKILVTVPASLVDAFFDTAIKTHTQYLATQGFTRGDIPRGYVEQNFKAPLTQHVQQFIFNYFVVDTVYRQLHEKKVLYGGCPKLNSIELEPHADAKFHFELSTIPEIPLLNWRYFPFKAPKRKNYKDLDRQVENFLKEEREKMDDSQRGIDVGDLVSFDIYIIDDNGKPLFETTRENFWLKIGDEAGDEELQSIFLTKKLGDVFCSSVNNLQHYFSDELPHNYNFCIEIKDIIHAHYFCFDLLKKHFKLKTQKELNQKLIEVFSYRNDLSQRRSTVEDAFKLLLSKHKFDVPNYFVLRQQDKIMESLSMNPDFHVYRVQTDFKEQVRRLAEKQTKELMIIDQIAAKEDLSVNHEDLKGYLNLTLRPRMKEFLYFTPPNTKFYGRETPLAAEQIKQQCLREKTLNHVLYHLTKQ